MKKKLPMKEKNKMKDLTHLSDEEVLNCYDLARSRMSYYNAAEGNWSKETTERNNAKHYLNIVRSELKRRRLEGRPGNYLC